MGRSKSEDIIKDGIKQRKCNTCGKWGILSEIKEESDYYKNKNGRDNFSAMCKTCQSASSKKSAAANIEDHESVKELREEKSISEKDFVEEFLWEIDDLKKSLIKVLDKTKVPTNIKIINSAMVELNKYRKNILNRGGN